MFLIFEVYSASNILQKLICDLILHAKHSQTVDKLFYLCGYLTLLMKMLDFLYRKSAAYGVHQTYHVLD